MHLVFSHSIGKTKVQSPLITLDPHRNPSVIVTLTSLRVSSIVTLPLIKCTWVDFLDSSFETSPYLDRNSKSNNRHSLNETSFS